MDGVGIEPLHLPALGLHEAYAVTGAVDQIDRADAGRRGGLVERSLMKPMWWVLCSFVIAAAAFPLSAQQDHLANWPPGRSPQEIGKRLSEHFVVMPHQGKTTIVYSEVGTWYGALSFAELTHDADLRDRLIRKFEPLMPGGAEADRIPQRDHVDDSIFGIVPLEIAIQIHDKKYLDFGLTFADRQWEHPTADGLSQETRFWIDDMYMLTILQLEAYRATGDRKYLDRDANEMVAYLDKLQQPSGLFYHAPDVPFYWGRGDGWVAAGMTEMLLSLPADHPRRARIMKSYKLMMSALLRYQAADGMWRQLIDHDDSWEESSSTGMFTFAMIAGVKKGWLDATTYGQAARKGWIGVTGFIDQNDNVTGVCEGTNKMNSLDWYLNRQRRTGDFHGFEPIMWSASELLR
jgi:unsaturated rhamnogalacturonyl hydrolase